MLAAHAACKTWMAVQGICCAGWLDIDPERSTCALRLASTSLDGLLLQLHIRIAVTRDCARAKPDC